jgi:uncharacterized protein YabE (DUF348 family)
MKKFSQFKLFYHRQSRRLVVVAVTLLVMVIISVTSVAMASNDDNKAARSERLVTIYDDGTERTILTRADTVGAALNDAAITTSQGDAVEPKLDSKFTGSSTNINIYRARPVVVIDGSRQIRVVTAAQSKADIAQAAGLALDSADQADLSRVEDLVTAGGAGLRLTIQRAKTINLVLYGKAHQLKTLDKTVSQLLSSKQIKLGRDDTLQPALDSPIENNMTIEIWRNGVQTVTVEEEISFTTETINDSTQEKGWREVRTIGQNGLKSVTYKIEMKNGQEISRQAIQSVVLQPAVNQVEAVGTKSNAPAYNANGSHEEWMRAAGIAPENFAYAEFLVARESGWNPNAVNRSSGACGLPQALPCSKLGPNWNNPVVALSWMNGYVGRYGGWAGAYEFWQSHHWY